MIVFLRFRSWPEGYRHMYSFFSFDFLGSFVGDSQIPLACSMFLESHGTELLRKSLYRNFVLHMISLHDFGLIGTGVVYKSILQLQSK